MVTKAEVKKLARARIGLRLITAGKLPDPYKYSSKEINQCGVRAVGALVALLIIWATARHSLAPQLLCFAAGLVAVIYAGYNLLRWLSEAKSRRDAYRAWYNIVELEHLLRLYKLDSSFTASETREEVHVILKDWRTKHGENTRTLQSLKTARGDRFEVLVQELFPPK